MYLDLESSKNLWKANPWLKRHKALSEPKDGFDEDDLRDIIIFCHFYADPKDSPFSDERDFDARLTLSLDAANIENPNIKSALSKFLKKDNKITDYAIEVMSAYLMASNATLWRSWFTSKVNYERVSYFLLTPLDAKDMEKAAKQRHEIAEANEKAGARILEMEMRLFASEDIARRISEQAMEEALAGPAEIYAESIEDDIANMYGSRKEGDGDE